MSPNFRNYVRNSFFLLAFFLPGLANIACGQDITRVEEDWVTEIIDPNREVTAPQFTSVMTPDQNDQSTYFTVEFNHSTSPEFVGGGLQLQTWANDALVDASPRLNERTLDNNDERVSWTQYMEVKDGAVEFGLSRLQSSTWNQVDLATAKVTGSGASHGTLNNYHIYDSTTGSGVGFASNRVGNMILLEVRAYSGDQLVQQVQVNNYVKRRSR
jgi:hypothetical protein